MHDIFTPPEKIELDLGPIGQRVVQFDDGLVVEIMSVMRDKSTRYGIEPEINGMPRAGYSIISSADKHANDVINNRFIAPTIDSEGKIGIKLTNISTNRFGGSLVRTERQWTTSILDQGYVTNQQGGTTFIDIPPQAMISTVRVLEVVPGEAPIEAFDPSDQLLVAINQYHQSHIV